MPEPRCYEGCPHVPHTPACDLASKPNVPYCYGTFYCGGDRCAAHETRPDRDALREQDWHRAAAAVMSGYGPAQAYGVSAALWPAVLAVVEPALAQRDAEIRSLRNLLDDSVRDLRQQDADLAEARRVIAAVEALCDDWDGFDSVVLLRAAALDGLRAALASGDRAPT